MKNAALFSTISVLISLASPALAYTVFTADESGNDVSIIDSETGKTERFQTSFSPHNVDLSIDKHQLLVTGMAAMDMANSKASRHGQMGKLLVIDVGGAQPKLIGEYDVGGHPAHVVPAHSGGIVYISDSANDQVLVFDLHDKLVRNRIVVGAYPHGIRLSPDGKTLAVANLKGKSVSVVDVTTGRETKRITVGRGPVQLAFTPSGDRLLVALNGEGKVVLIDIKSGKLVRTWTVGRGPVQVFITPNGETGIVANQGTVKTPDNRISFVDLTGQKSVVYVQTGAGAHGIFVSSDGAQAFVTNSFADTLSVIDIPGRRVLKTYPTGAGPNGIVAR